MRGAAGYGISHSSLCAVLEAAGRVCREWEGSVDADAVIDLALGIERTRAKGRRIAADDVVPITRGGAGLVYTGESGSIRHRRIPCDESWVAGHLLFAHDPAGPRHRAPELLESLFAHPRAGEFVGSISATALQASAGLWRGDAPLLAVAIRRYVSIFDKWSGGRFVHDSVRKVVGELEGTLGGGLLAWKPPGAGAASSLVALVADGAMGDARGALTRAGWEAGPLVVTGGLRCDVDGPGGLTRISAGHRVDLVGAADLGSDPSIGRDGICCSIAVEPRCELVLKAPRPGSNPSRRGLEG